MVLFDTDEASRPASRPASRGLGIAVQHRSRGIIRPRGPCWDGRQALRDHGSKNIMGDNAIVQPGHMQEVLLHETAVLWIHLRLASTVPSKVWLGTMEQHASRLRTVVGNINVSRVYAKASQSG